MALPLIAITYKRYPSTLQGVRQALVLKWVDSDNRIVLWTDKQERAAVVRSHIRWKVLTRG